MISHAIEALARTSSRLQEAAPLLSRPPHQSCLSVPTGEGAPESNAAWRVAEVNIEFQAFNLDFSATRVVKGAALADFVAKWTDALDHGEGEDCSLLLGDGEPDGWIV